MIAKGTEAKVCELIAQRQARGICKYGTTVADNPLELRQWLTHALEEALDLAIYLQRSIEELDSKDQQSHAVRWAKQAPELDADGWIKWLGGDRPVDADAMVNIEFRSGRIAVGIRAAVFCWSHVGHSSDIVAYKAVKAEAPAEQATPEPDADGWIKWGGGDCPVYAGTRVHIQYRNGYIRDAVHAGAVHWPHTGGDFDIVAYIVVETKAPAKQAPEPEADEWKKWYGGDRPVASGALVEIESLDGWIQTQYAGNVRWYHLGRPEDVVAYKVVKAEAPAEQAAPEAPEADEDGWIKWGGGDCPVGVRELVFLRWRCGATILDHRSAGGVRWNHLGLQSDVVAYKIDRQGD